MQPFEVRSTTVSLATKRPYVGLTCDTQDDLPYPAHAVPKFYVSGLVRATGFAPLLIPAVCDETGEDFELSGLDGLLVTGGRSNVHPSTYAVSATSDHGPFDRARDRNNFSLIARAIAIGLPIFCICRGMQELNVALGGTLANDIHTMEGVLDHRAPKTPDMTERFAPRHAVHVEPNCQLHQILGRFTFAVNSLHRQAIDRLADGLTVVARAPDGIVEAVEMNASPGFVLAVQWHPEALVGRDSPSDALFAAFARAVRSRHAARASD